MNAQHEIAKQIFEKPKKDFVDGFSYYGLTIANEYIELVLHKDKGILGLFDSFEIEVRGLFGGYWNDPLTFKAKSPAEEYRVFLTDGTRVGKEYTFTNSKQPLSKRYKKLKQKYSRSSGSSQYLIVVGYSNSKKSEIKQWVILSNGAIVSADDALIER